MLGILYAALGAFTFALNNVAIRRGVVTGSVLQGMALTVPVGGLCFLVMTVGFGELHHFVLFPMAAVAWLAGFDGEVIAADETGRPQFYDLLRSGARATWLRSLVAQKGADLCALPLHERRQRLARLLSASEPVITQTVAVESRGRELFELMCERPRRHRREASGRPLRLPHALAEDQKSRIFSEGRPRRSVRETAAGPAALSMLAS